MNDDWLDTRSRTAGYPIVEVHEAHDELDPERCGDLVEGRQAGEHVAGPEALDGGLDRAETFGELALARPPLLLELADFHSEHDRLPSALAAADDVRSYIDVEELASVFDELVLPPYVRATWSEWFSRRGRDRP